MSIFKDLIWYFKQEKRNYITGIMILVIVSFLLLIPPYVVGVLVDGINEGTLHKEKLIQWILFLLGIGLIVYILRYGWRILIFGSALRLGKLLRNRLYEHFSMMSPQFFQQKRIGDLMAHSTNDVQAVEGTAGEGVLTLVDSLTLGGFVIITMAVMIHWPLTLIVLLPMPIMALATSHYGKLLHQRFHHAQAAFSELNDKVQENISGVRVIKAFGQEEAEKAVFKEQSKDVVNKNIAVARIDALFEPTITFIVGFSFMLAVGFGSWFVVREEITVGQLATFIMYLGMLIWPMLAFGWLFNIVERGRASYDRIRALLAEKPTITDSPNAKAEIPSGDIHYRVNQYFYPQAVQPTLEQIDFHIKQGQTLGVVGKTGAGKTTLFRLLMREFDCENGDICIGPHSIYEVQKAYLRKGIGYVPQDHFLFSATIAENIAFGCPEATTEEIRRAAQIACIHEDIMQFKYGYETTVGERGVTLSGGQKQRLSIARALLINPEILILDDSLSAVDAKTEEAIIKELRENRKDKTTLISAHRLSAIQHADLILVLEEGKIIERGTHHMLMKNQGWYCTMYQHQQLEFLVQKGEISS